jgi:hypothetical protein
MPEQRGVLPATLLALAIAVAAIAAVIFFRPLLLMPAATPLQAFAPALRWDILPLVCLAAHIAVIARRRFVTRDDLDGSGPAEGAARVRVAQATLQNTLEQAVLALSTHVVWALTMPRPWQGVIAVAAILFFIGCLLFWRGQGSGAATRAFGFALTFYPSLLMLLILAVHFVVPL